MRIWMVEPKLMCRNHLLGEHHEIHMVSGSLQKGKNLSGYLHGLVVPTLLHSRHDDLVSEMANRGYKHNSSLNGVDISLPEALAIDVEANVVELSKRCSKCRKLQEVDYELH